jgi:hypothetical protein
MKQVFSCQIYVILLLKSSDFHKQACMQKQTDERRLYN